SWPPWPESGHASHLRSWGEPNQTAQPVVEVQLAAIQAARACPAALKSALNFCSATLSWAVVAVWICHDAARLIHWTRSPWALATSSRQPSMFAGSLFAL